MRHGVFFLFPSRFHLTEGSQLKRCPISHEKISSAANDELWKRSQTLTDSPRVTWVDMVNRRSRRRRYRQLWIFLASSIRGSINYNGFLRRSFRGQCDRKTRGLWSWYSGKLCGSAECSAFEMFNGGWETERRKTRHTGWSTSARNILSDYPHFPLVSSHPSSREVITSGDS